MNGLQRLRIRFTRGEEIRFISHLDIMRLWQRALNRAGIAVAYSEGFNPHPRMSLAAPLALGVTSEAELMDIVLERWSSPHNFSDALNRQLPPGIRIVQVYNIAPNLPSLQSQVRFAEYLVQPSDAAGPEDRVAAIETVLSKAEIPWEHLRDTGPRRYDLRKLIEDIWLEDDSIGMKLRCDSGGSGRPEQVYNAMGFTGYPRGIHRTKLLLQAK